MRRKAAAAEAAADRGPGPPTSPEPPRAAAAARETWAMLLKRVSEIDPRTCSQCGGQMKVVAFIEPPQRDVIEKILRHCGLWCASSPRAPRPTAIRSTTRTATGADTRRPTSPRS